MRSRAPLPVSMFAGLLAPWLLGIGGLDAPALASIQSPPEEACAGKGVDDACTLPSGESGACKADKCNQLDYSQGSPPQSIEVDCIVCVAGAAPPPGPGPVEVGGDGGANAPGETAPATGAEPRREPAAAPPDASPEPPSSDARCSVASAGDGSSWPVSLALVGLLAVARRRRA